MGIDGGSNASEEYELCEHSTSVFCFMKFKLIKYIKDGKTLYHLKSWHGKYANCDSNGNTMANVKKPGSREAMQFISVNSFYVVIKHYESGNYLRIQDKTIECDTLK